MKEKFMRFMQGRYGVLDTLGKVLLVLGLVLAFFAPVFSGDHVIGMVFYLLGWGCLIYAYFRMFSRNVRKRYDENVRFLNKTAKIRGFFKSQKSLMAQRKGLSYLYLSGMQAENPDSERQGKDRDPLSEVRDNIYQEELRLHKGIEHKGEQTKDNDRSISCVGSITRCF